MSGLTTHVLDLTAGRPAADVAVKVFQKRGSSWRQGVSTRTDADGRARLIGADDFSAGAYRLEFEIGPYFRRTGAAAADPGFLETVAIECRLNDPAADHHVPLLVSPFGYSTYRGS